MVVNGAIDELNRVPHRLVSRVGIGRVHRVDDLHHRLGVEAAGLGHEMPDHERHVEEECHERQDEGHPLVVVDHVLARLVRIGQRVVGGHVVGVGDPADVVGVLDHGAGELRRRPAGDGRAHELRAAHQQGEHDQHAHCVAVAQAVREVIVLNLIRLDHSLYGVNELPNHFLFVFFFFFFTQKFLLSIYLSLWRARSIWNLRSNGDPILFSNFNNINL